MVFAKSAMPCWGKTWIKMLPRAIQKQLSKQHPNLHRFRNQLVSILEGVWGAKVEPSWHKIAVKINPKNNQQKWSPSRWHQDRFLLNFGTPNRQKSLLGGSWGALGNLRGPKRLPREPKRHPRASKEAPKGRPRGATEGSRVPGAPGERRGSPGETQDESRVSSKRAQAWIVKLPVSYRLWR